MNRVVLNDSRWVRGDAAYIGDLAEYRIYMINHETGHALGHLHATEKLWQDSRGRMCVRGSAFAAKPPQ